MDFRKKFERQLLSHLIDSETRPRLRPIMAQPVDLNIAGEKLMSDTDRFGAFRAMNFLL